MWGPRDRVVLELQRQRNGTEVQSGPFGGTPKSSAKTWFGTWRSNTKKVRDPWHADAMESDTLNRFFGAEDWPATTLTPMSDIPEIALPEPKLEI